ncbi:hypothetical protein SUGI_0048200 [Cryptomeria japonica]|uniref:putative pectinesterase 14 n=1 Tax=Cryptomeria japonica TaxID=3369 RepID=UPI002408E307|nr:putative pectinesterase 14 [Cryptomeria japonica]GLJ06788.1 hypothetical protein SUGI_0048200 [Cryptomeria japonica]
MGRSRNSNLGLISPFRLLPLLSVCFNLLCPTWQIYTLTVESFGSVFRGHCVLSNTPTRQIVSYFEKDAGIVVDQMGFGDYRTIQEAVDSVPDNNMERIVIQINAGVYLEKIHIGRRKSNITFQGQGGDVTHICWNDTAATSGSTRSSASVTVDAPDFIANDISFNNFAYPTNGTPGSQAVALRVSGDTAAFYNCSFYGAQDTLFDDKGRHYFHNCYIEGTTDFIFGHGLSLYQECELHSIAGVDPLRITGCITAQNRQTLPERTGFSFVSCSITGTGQIYLGRAWGTYSRVVFSYTEMIDIVAPQGWSDWGDPSKDQSVYYGEYKCTGSGSDRSKRVDWSHQLTDDEAALFLNISFIDGDQWLDLTKSNVTQFVKQ